MLNISIFLGFLRLFNFFYLLLQSAAGINNGCYNYKRLCFVYVIKDKIIIN